jgi:Prolyl oligopeptidase family
MIRWLWSRWTSGLLVMLVAALAAAVTNPVAGLGRADVCADSGAQYAQVGRCADPNSLVTDAVPPPEYVPPPREYRKLPPPVNIPHPKTSAQWSMTDSDGPLPQGLWNGGTVQYEVGTYMSDGLQIYGLICYPVSPGPHPVLVVNHGVLFLGALGLDTASFNGCTQMAAAGWLVATTTYRGWTMFASGTPGVTTFPPDSTFTRQSQGQFEFCGGEVDDSLNLLAAVKQLPQANANQVVMWGHSHGSCITELAVERGAAPQIAVSLDGPTDFTNTTWQALNSQYGAAWCDSCGPTDTDQLTARSSAWSGNTPTNLATAKFLRVQAEGDGIVVPDFGCQLAAALGPQSSNYFLYPETSPPGTYVAPPKECAPWLPNPCYLDKTGSHCGAWKLGQLLPDTGKGGPWASPTFLMYACPQNVCTGPDRSPTGNEGAIEHGAIMEQSWPEVADFVNHFASGWSASFPPQFVPIY